MKKMFGIVLVLCLLLGFSSSETAAQGGGYELGYGLWAKAVLKVANNPVTLLWKEVGSDTTPSGDKVIGGYFYADPNDFAYGSEYNAEVFVKVYIATNGWANIAFNHVTVDNVDVYSAHNYTGTHNQSSTISLVGRLAEHSYTGVSTATTGGSFDGIWTGSGYATTVLDDYGDPCARPTSINMTVTNGSISGSVVVSVGYTFLLSGSVLSDGTVIAGLVQEAGGDEVATFSGKIYQLTGAGNGTWQDQGGCRGTWTVVKQ
ncbi:MAG: hypothetical protein JXL81_01955 [Deltaproteobacteria bacterium]|nr:hypothetical protein [Deltaproteobacteria bacterium]